MASSVDWELWFAYMEPVEPNFTLDLPDDVAARLALAAYLLRPCGIHSLEEFVEMVMWEMTDSLAGDAKRSFATYSVANDHDLALL